MQFLIFMFNIINW